MNGTVFSGMLLGNDSWFVIYNGDQVITIYGGLTGIQPSILG